MVISNKCCSSKGILLYVDSQSSEKVDHLLLQRDREGGRTWRDVDGEVAGYPQIIKYTLEYISKVAT